MTIDYEIQKKKKIKAIESSGTHFVRAINAQMWMKYIYVKHTGFMFPLPSHRSHSISSMPILNGILHFKYKPVCFSMFFTIVLLPKYM